MATNWYDPSGSNAGFYNSPQDFLFKGNDSTWYGQGPSGQEDAARMPTMGDYYFGNAQPSDPAAAPIQQVYGGPTRPEGYNAPAPSRMGGGGSINLGDNVTVPQGPLWQRYQALQANPAMMEADPAYRYMLEQGEEALGRSAGARRKRFAGGTMLDFQRHAQGQAAGYLQRMLPELRAGAGQEYDINRQNVLGQRAESGAKALQADPYGQARRIASTFPTFDAYQQAWGKHANIDLYRRGQELNKSLWGG